MSTDRIEKRIVLRAPRERVWNAISDAKQFGLWFGVVLDGPFVAGQRVTGHIVPTQVDPGVAKEQEPYRGLPVEWLVEQVEPMQRFAFRWHPYAVDKDRDYSSEPMTLVEFVLEDVAGGVELTISESGFDHIPLERRAKAFTMNEGGWAAQAELIQKYLAKLEKR